MFFFYQGIGPSYFLNEENFLNYCRNIGGMENSNLNQLENNKYILKMLLASQSTSSMYNSWFSTWFANLSGSNPAANEYLLNTALKFNTSTNTNSNTTNQQQNLGVIISNENLRSDLKSPRNLEIKKS